MWNEPILIKKRSVLIGYSDPIRTLRMENDALMDTICGGGQVAVTEL